MRKLVQRLLLLLALTAFAMPAVAANPAPGQPASEPATTADDLEKLLDTLEDDDKRKDFVKDLRSLIDAQKQTEAAAEEPIGSRVLEMLSDKVEDTGKRLGEAASAILNVPTLAYWIQTQIADPETRVLWIWAIIKLAIIIAAGLAGEWVVRRLLRNTKASIETQEADAYWLQWVFAVARAVLDLVAVAAFAAAAYGVMTLTDPGDIDSVIALALINAGVITRGVMVIADMLLAPRVSSMRLLPIDDETSNYIVVWLRRLSVLSVYGVLLIHASLPLGMPLVVHEVFIKLLGLFLGLLLIMLILQNRHAVAARIRGNDSGVFRHFFNRFADIWHILLIVYMVGIYGVWLVDVPGGFEFVMRATLLSVVIVVVARIVVALLRRGLRRAFELGDDRKRRFPGLEARTNRYLPLLLGTVKWVCYTCAILALLDVWGIGAITWVNSPTGRAFTGHVVTIALIIVIALVVWEVTSALIEQYLSSTDRHGNVVTRSQRIQTLLPLVRNIVLIVLGVMATLTILSEIGINIGPLIAGAGILGLAIGFGAQTFVKDVITGFFILIEDTVAVGDIVTLGNHSGRVEAMSIRSIQLRDIRGDVHRVPFSEVTTTINKSKIFSYAFFDIGVAYREDVDRCMNVIREVGQEMRDDPQFSPVIIDDIEIMGVQSFDESAVTIRARIKVQPGKQRGIQRAYNRMIKNRFDAEGIEIPFPHRTIYFGVDHRGAAPPAHILLEDPEHRKQQPEPPPPPKAELTEPVEGEGSDAGDNISDEAASEPVEPERTK
ncbi:MAG: mechanosensitive ion channel [Alphaproteobacteria bacterium]|nr:mechanosensitive ion channel [Alphaproteobacteria bacterium]